MSTAQDIINSAALQADLIGLGQVLTGAMNADALSRLNRMVDRWRNNGVDLGLGTLASSTELYVDDADLECIEYSLTLRLMIRYKRPVGREFIDAVDEMVTELRAKYTVRSTLTLDSAMTHHRPYDRTYNINTDA